MKKLIVIIMFLLVITLLAGCTSTKRQEGNSTKQAITYNIHAEPETLDPSLSTGVIEFTIQNALFEGLVRLNDQHLPIPGVAKKWSVSSDGKKYTFYLRDSRWSNGDPLTAEDFVYAWRRVLDPKTASLYAYQLYYLKNGRPYNEGKIKDPAQIGVKAVGPKVLEVFLESPTPYFLSLTAFPTFFPVHQGIVKEKKEKWATSPETLIGNGPFKMIKWKHNEKIVLVKNENYWDKNSVKLQQITMVMIDNPNTSLTMFENGQLDLGGRPPYGEMERLIKDGKVKVGPDLTVEYYMFNLNKSPFNNLKIRKAMVLAIDRQAIVKNIAMGGQVPALAFVPVGLQDADPAKDFRKTGGNYFLDNDIQTARRLMKEAGYPEGKGFPTVELLLNNNPNLRLVAEAIAQMWAKNLGIKTDILTQDWQVYLNSRSNGDFQIARVGWNADYPDPVTFLDLWESKGANNQAHWKNDKYDLLIEAAKETADLKVRMKALHEAERILMEEFPVIPLYFYTNPYLQKDYVKNVIHPNFAFDVELKWAYVEK